MNARFRDGLGLVVSAAVGFAILAVLFLYVIDVNRLLLAIETASIHLLILALASTLGNFVARALRWRAILIPLKNPLSMGATFWPISIGIFVNLIFPIHVAGDFTKSVIFDRKERVGVLRVLSSVFVERILDTIMVISLAFVALNFLPPANTHLTLFIDALRILMAIALGIMVVALISAKSRGALLSYIDRLLNAIPPLGHARRTRLHDLASAFLEGAKSIAQRPFKIAEIFILTLSIWIFEFMSIYLTFLALHYDVPMATVLMGTMLMNVSFMIPSLPGYAGTYEALWLIVYGALGLTDLTLLTALALVNHLLSILWVTGLGTLGMVWIGLSFKEILGFRQLRETGGVEAERLL